MYTYHTVHFRSGTRPGPTRGDAHPVAGGELLRGVVVLPLLRLRAVRNAGGEGDGVVFAHCRTQVAYMSASRRRRSHRASTCARARI